MKLADSRILLTGATGGIGRCLALELARRGARLALTARDETRLLSLASKVSGMGAAAAVLPFDLAGRSGHAALVDRALDALGGLDILVNNAGQSRFGAFASDAEEAMRQMMAVNVTAPLLLTRAALPRLVSSGRGGRIVNVGSVLGAIGFPYFTAYSTCKFALRGFSEALRRELTGTGVGVLYVAPRTTATGLNGPAVQALMAETRATVDPPEPVARQIVEAIESDRAELTLGMPERTFVLLNALAPRLVDKALRGQARAASRHLEPAKPSGGP